MRHGIVTRIEQAYDVHACQDLDGNQMTAAWNPRGCLKGYTVHRRVCGPYRVKAPMVRAGWKAWVDDGFPDPALPENRQRYFQRGQDRWVRTSWDEAATLVAKGLLHIQEKYSGPAGVIRLRAQGYPEAMIEAMGESGARAMKFRAGMWLLGLTRIGSLYRFANMLALLDANMRNIVPEPAMGGRGWTNFDVSVQGVTRSCDHKLHRLHFVLDIFRLLRYDGGIPRTQQDEVCNPRRYAVASAPPLPAGLPLDAGEWEQASQAVRQLVLQLRAVVQQQHTSIQHLETRLKTLEARITELEARLQQRSRHSDRPPSSNPPYEKRTAHAGSQGRPGAKPGHVGHRQALLEPTQVIEVKPRVCPCGQRECPEAMPYYTRQVLELPEIQMVVKHFVVHEARCPQGGRVTKAQMPPEALDGYGPRLTALIGELSGSQRDSRSTVQEFC